MQGERILVYQDGLQLDQSEEMIENANIVLFLDMNLAWQDSTFYSWTNFMEILQILTPWNILKSNQIWDIWCSSLCIMPCLQRWWVRTQSIPHKSYIWSRLGKWPEYLWCILEDWIRLDLFNDDTRPSGHISRPSQVGFSHSCLRSVNEL